MNKLIGLEINLEIEMEIVACNIGAVTPMRIRLDVIGRDVITWMINSIQGYFLEIIMGVGYWKAHIENLTFGILISKKGLRIMARSRNIT